MGDLRPGFGLANADNEGEIADLTDLDYAFGGVEPQNGSSSTVQENPVFPGYDPVVCPASTRMPTTSRRV